MPCKVVVNIQFIISRTLTWVEESDCSINSHYVFKIDVSLIFKYFIPQD